MKKYEILRLTITDYAFEGRGIAKIETEEDPEKKFVIFVDGAYPGDVVDAKIIKIKKSYAEALTAEVIVPSPDRIAAQCKHFSVCGGCKQQDLEYNKQAEYKQLQTEDIFERIAGLTDFVKEGIVKAEKNLFYRNKMEYSFSEKRWLTYAEINSGVIFNANFACGLHVPQVYDKVLDINECLLQAPLASEILRATKEFFADKEVKGYNSRNHDGWLRNLVIRNSLTSGEIMINLVTLSEKDELMKEFTTAITGKFAEITTIVNNVNTRKAQVATGDYEIVYFGSGYINDSIGNRNYRISANSFFQTNTEQANNLYSVATEYAAFNKSDVVYDFYCGAGTITLFIADYVKEVYGFEAVEPAIKDAEHNKKHNNVENASFFLADLYKSALPLIQSAKIPKPDVIVLDPPRAGMHNNTINDVLSLSPNKLVYVSCNPATQARDIKLLTEGGYKLVKIKQVDMFPQTFHIENVALLVK